MAREKAHFEGLPTSPHLAVSGFFQRCSLQTAGERRLTQRRNDDSDAYVPDVQVDELGLEVTPESGIFSDVVTDTLPGPNFSRLLILFHRLFEAHFLPVQMTILVVASTLYLWVTDGNSDVHQVGWIFTWCKYLRTAGFMEVALYLALYEGFHRVCVEMREKEMSDAGLSKGMHFSHRVAKTNFIDYVMVPLVAPLYGSIPCAQAQIFHFWTMDLVYTVSKKVTRKRGKSFVEAIV